MKAQSQITLQTNCDGLTVRIRTKFGERELGSIRNNTFHTFRSEAKHLLRAMNGLCINRELILNRKEFPFERIEIRFQHVNGEIENLRLTRGYFIEHGHIWKWLQNSAETQLVLSLDELRDPKIVSRDHSTTQSKQQPIQQESLFPSMMDALQSLR